MADDSPTESKAAHTPAPWSWHHMRGEERYWVESAHEQRAGVNVCIVVAEGPEGLANAALIAAAPETKRQRDMLLEFAKGLFELVDYDYEPAQLANQIARGDLCPVAKDRLEALRAAISACEESDNA